MKGKNQDIQDIIDFVTAYDSYLSGLLDSSNSDSANIIAIFTWNY